jgi:hypothetical protein
LPPQGYWARKKRHQPPPLPATNGHTCHKIQVQEKPMPVQVPGFIDPRSEKILEFECNPRNRIIVGKKLWDPHPLVSTTKEQLRQAQPDTYGRLNSWRKGGLGVSVCPPSINRALLILDAIVKALEGRGFKVVSQDGRGEVFLLDERLAFAINETVKRYDVVYTPAQRKAKPYGYFPRWGYNPTGTLSLKINDGTYDIDHLAEGKNQCLEDCLNQFVISLVKAAERVKINRLERQRQEEEWKREREEREARQREIEQEKERQRQLEIDAVNWAKARKIRQYIKAVKVNYGIDELAEEQANWIFWASNYADSIDPLLGAASPFHFEQEQS